MNYNFLKNALIYQVIYVLLIKTCDVNNIILFTWMPKPLKMDLLALIDHR
jgi:hypothetical protein